MDIQKRKNELKVSYEEQKKLHEQALTLVKQTEESMLKLDGAFQELTRLEQEEEGSKKDQPKEEENDRKK